MNAGLGFDEAGQRVPVALPPDSLGDACPYCSRPYDDQTPAAGIPAVAIEHLNWNPIPVRRTAAGIPAVAIEHLQTAFEKGREQGRAEGMRELLQRLFQNVSTPQELTDRAAALAFAETWPDNEPCPLTVADLASITGTSLATAKRRKAQARLSHSFADE